MLIFNTFCCSLTMAFDNVAKELPSLSMTYVLSSSLVHCWKPTIFDVNENFFNQLYCYYTNLIQFTFFRARLANNCFVHVIKIIARLLHYTYCTFTGWCLPRLRVWMPAFGTWATSRCHMILSMDPYRKATRLTFSHTSSLRPHLDFPIRAPICRRYLRWTLRTLAAE